MEVDMTKNEVSYFLNEIGFSDKIGYDPFKKTK